MNQDEKIQHPLREHYASLWKICFLYGICYAIFAFQNLDGIGSGIFSLISVVVILFIATLLKKDNLLPRIPNITPISVFYLVMAVCISFANCLTDNFFFLFFNHIGSFLLFSIGCIKLFYHDKEWDFSKYTCMLTIFWCQVLSVIPMPFEDFSFYRKEKKTVTKEKNPTTKYIFIGILCGLPILLITTALLASADMIFSDFLNKVFNINGLLDFMDQFMGNIFEYCILLPMGFFIYYLLLYLVMGALSKGGLNEEIKEPHRFQAVIGITIFIMIDIVYVLFSTIQFVYLFGGFPSDTYTYAEYAREGFFQLLFVALINFVLVLFSNRHFSKNMVLKIVMTITCICTFVMIVSSAYRMRLYIHEYHLTFLRVFVLWFLLVLAFLMVGSTLSIYIEKWNSFRYSLFVFTIFYTGFALSNVDKQIAKYNVAQFEKAFNQGKNVSLSRYLPDGYDCSKCYGKELSNLFTTYQNQLSDSDRITIIYYFVDNYDTYFGDYSSMEYYSEETDFILDKNAYIYDEEKQASIVSWKHFNFVEAESYTLYKTYYNEYKNNPYYNNLRFRLSS